MSECVVLTPTIDTRSDRLAEACASVAAQDRPPVAHLIGFDSERRGGPATLRDLTWHLALGVDYACVLPDDDLLEPDHLATACKVLDERPEIDVVSTWCRTTGRTFAGYNVDRIDRGMVQQRSCVSHTAVFRASWLDRVQWTDGAGWDWRFWKDLASCGAGFDVVPHVTWTYRLDGPNESWGETP